MKKKVLREYLELRKMKKINKKLSKIANEVLEENLYKSELIEKPKRKKTKKGE